MSLSHTFALNALLISLTLGTEVLAQAQVPESSLYSPKPSQDLSWAYGDWVAKVEHPVHGAITEWRVKINSNGRFSAELSRPKMETIFERGLWITTDREVWTFVTFERDRKSLPLPTQDFYTILAIGTDALELRHMKNGRVLRMERGGV
jgi:hypothetical protein